MKRYPEYKDSGIEWIGDIPEGWKAGKLKRLANVRVSNIDKKSNEGEFPVGLCNYTDVYYNQQIKSGLDFMRATTPHDKIKDFTLQAGDVLITKDSETADDIAVPAFVPQSLPGIVCGYHLALIRPNSKLTDGNYLFRSFVANGIRDQFEISANGITRFGIGKYAIDNSLFLCPPLDEQNSISKYLDHKTRLIDTLIEKKQKQIELLQEQRTGIINHAVTKGLNPNVKMKDTGIEWVGEVPEHWKIKKTKYIFKLSTDKAPENNDYELLSLYTDIGVRPRKELEARGNKASSTDGYLLVKKGDIVVNKLLAWMGAIGHSAYDGVTSPAYDILRQIKPLNSKYYHYLFRGGLYLTEFKRRSRGIMDMRLRLYFDEFGQILLPYPSENEQNQIAEYIDGVIGKVKSLIKKLLLEIELLQEYRTTLISEVVTGKIDVRDEVIP